MAKKQCVIFVAICNQLKTHFNC